VVATCRVLRAPVSATNSGMSSPVCQENLFSHSKMIWDFLIIGSEANAHDLAFLDREKITHVLNLTTTPSRPEVLASRSCRQIMLQDSATQDILSFIPTAIEFMHEARTSGGRLLVHCLAGVSRSSAMVTAYAMWHCQLSLTEAYDIIRAHRPCASPNLNFMGQLLMFSKCLCCKASSPGVRSVSSPAQAALLASVCLRKSPVSSPQSSECHPMCHEAPPATNCHA